MSFHDFSFQHFGAETWRLLRRLRSLAKSHVDVVWIKGNHDRHLADVAATLTGIQMRESFRWTAANDVISRCMATVSTPSSLAIVGSVAASRASTGSASAGYPAKVTGRKRSTVCTAGSAGWATKSQCEPRASHAAAPLTSSFAAIRTRRSTAASRAPPRAPPVDYYNAGAWSARPASFLAVDDDGVRIVSCP